MSIDRRLESSAEQLRQRADGAFDTAAALDRLQRSRSRRRLSQRAGAVLALVLVLVGAAYMVTPRRQSAPPVLPVPSPPTVCSVDTGDPCPGGSTYQVDAGSFAFTWSVPAGWNTGAHRRGAATDQTSTMATAAAWPSDSHPELSGVVVLASAVASDPAHPAMDVPGPSDPSAQALARWVAQRPYLVAGPLSSTRIGGLPAWQLDVRVGPLDASSALHWPDLGHHDDCGCPRMAAVLRGAQPRAGTPRDLLLLQGDHGFRLWFIDVPGAGVLVARAVDFGGGPVRFDEDVARSLRVTSGRTP
ncbi:MAG TPA: hypothetical protein VFL59_05565 [Candidatus Nanopelagicales bacterium]|nr:hypothetical protein [Candidatus Nanopelagicales bacterium]